MKNQFSVLEFAISIGLVLMNKKILKDLLLLLKYWCILYLRISLSFVESHFSSIVFIVILDSHWISSSKLILIMNMIEISLISFIFRTYAFYIQNNNSLDNFIANYSIFIDGLDSIWQILKNVLNFSIDLQSFSKDNSPIDH